MQASSPRVAIIIAAHNAAATIALPIATALREPEVAEIVVVDDASNDRTAAAAAAADDGSGRVSVIRLEQNMGPAFARNVAIEQSTAPLIGLLDADDFFIAGRLSRMLGHAGWDLIADNIVFVRDGTGAVDPAPALPHFRSEPEYLDLSRFVDGNISRRNAHRAELGFLKPVMSRAFLERHGLRYDESLRLGEDYELYARMLAHGARFKVIKSCGYGAVVRDNSLSGSHGAAELKLLADADLRLLAIDAIDAASRQALQQHERHVRGRYRLHRFLDIKSERGLGPALSFGLSEPGNLLPIALGVYRAKSAQFGRLLPGRPGAEDATASQFLLPATVADGCM